MLAHRGCAGTDVPSCPKKSHMRVLHGPLYAYVITMLRMLQVLSSVSLKNAFRLGTYPIPSSWLRKILREFSQNPESHQTRTTKTRAGCGCASLTKALRVLSRTGYQPRGRHEQEIALWPEYVCDVVLGSAKEHHRISILKNCQRLVIQMHWAENVGCFILNKVQRFSASQHCFSSPNVSFASFKSCFCKKAGAFEIRSNVFSLASINEKTVILLKRFSEHEFSVKNI